ncbi:MAG: ABC transporter ATP-binding protein [Chloroflexi bacterium]|nr:ABC transporter ATP-binding protein [Chloroflexota bacterium]MQC26348.1 ABC transporter ATP-binding protein [Chloroflexota bacterium]
MIEFRDFSYRYPTAAADSLSSLSLQIPRGQFCAVVGANGAGKSTFCFAASGFIPHFFRGEAHGSVELAGKPLAEAEFGSLAAEVGIVFQNPFNQISGARFTVREEIAFGLENLGVERGEMQTRIQLALEVVDLVDVAERSPFELSGGQQQRVALASMFAMRPQVLVLDEPTSQLDPRGTREVFRAIAALSEAGTTIILAGHKLEWLAEFADRAILLDQGRVIADGDPDTIFAMETMGEVGVGRTQFTDVAAAAQRAGMLKDHAALPVTLAQAEAFFS